MDFIALNTDVQQLQSSQAPVQIHIGQRHHAGSRLGLGPRRGARSSRRVLRPDQAGSSGFRHGVRDRWRGGRHRLGCGAHRGEDRSRARCADGRNRDDTVWLRGLATAAAVRRGRRGAALRMRHPDRDPQRSPARGARSRRRDGRGVQDRRRCPTPGRAGNLRPDHDARPYQPRLRRRAKP